MCPCTILYIENFKILLLQRVKLLLLVLLLSHKWLLDEAKSVLSFYRPTSLELILEPWSNKEYYYSPLDGMLVHCKFNTLPPLPSPPICTSGYKWVREALWDKVSHPRMQHNDSARFPTQTSQPRVQCTDHEATGSPDCYILGPYMI